MGKLRLRQENGGGGRRSGDEWCGKVPSPAVSVPAPLCCEGWGPERQGLPCPLVSPSGTGARGRETREWASPRCPSRPFPHRGGQRRPRRCGDGHLSGARGRGGGGRRARAPGSPFLPHPFLPVGLGMERGDLPGEGARKEKRSL